MMVSPNRDRPFAVRAPFYLERFEYDFGIMRTQLARKQKLTMSMRYTVSNGKLVLKLEAADEGGYVVTSPLDPELITQAETIEEAFANARDAAQALRQARVKLLRRLSATSTR